MTKDTFQLCQYSISIKECILTVPTDINQHLKLQFDANFFDTSSSNSIMNADQKYDKDIFAS